MSIYSSPSNQSANRLGFREKTKTKKRVQTACMISTIHICTFWAVYHARPAWWDTSASGQCRMSMLEHRKQHLLHRGM